MSQTLFHGLQAIDYDVVCMEARHVSAVLSAMRNKTDKNDACGFAQIVRSGWYRSVHMKSRDAHYIYLNKCTNTILSKALHTPIRNMHVAAIPTAEDMASALTAPTATTFWHYPHDIFRSGLVP